MPNRLIGVPGFTRPVSTINFLTARALPLLDGAADNLTHVKISRLQLLPTLAHLHWLQRNKLEANDREKIHVASALRHVTTD